VQRLFTREESREVDRVAVDELGVVSLVLMENAGRGATDAICEVFEDRLDRVVLVGGPGQNGGEPIGCFSESSTSTCSSCPPKPRHRSAQSFKGRP
jgi:NAD(P)H-hydrate repair Nnr-like enzyme with NAD(P)H-hydrate epimerase domain